MTTENSEISKRRSRKLRQISEPLVSEEVTALVRYASEKGIDPDGKTLSALSQAIADHDAAVTDKRPEKAGVVLVLYAKLTAVTSPVNGRTLLDTSSVIRSLSGLATVTILLLLVGLGNYVLSAWFGSQAEPEEGLEATFHFVHQYVLNVLEPFVWGAIGACVYLLKNLYDIAADRQFDKEKYSGWWLRVILGGTLGAVVVHLFDLKALGGTEENVALDAVAVAFLVGLGVKVVYGAFERLVNVLAEKMDLGALRRARVQPVEVHNYLSQKLAEASKQKDRERHAVLAELLKEFDQPAKS